MQLSAVIVLAFVAIVNAQNEVTTSPVSFSPTGIQIKGSRGSSVFLSWIPWDMITVNSRNGVRVVLNPFTGVSVDGTNGGRGHVYVSPLPTRGVDVDNGAGRRVSVNPITGVNVERPDRRVHVNWDGIWTTRINPSVDVNANGNANGNGNGGAQVNLPRLPSVNVNGNGNGNGGAQVNLPRLPSVNVNGNGNNGRPSGNVNVNVGGDSLNVPEVPDLSLGN